MSNETPASFNILEFGCRVSSKCNVKSPVLFYGFLCYSRDGSQLSISPYRDVLKGPSLRVTTN